MTVQWIDDRDDLLDGEDEEEFDFTDYREPARSAERAGQQVVRAADAVVPFGKYKGQPVEAMLSDPGYVQWALGQGVLDRYPVFKQIVINNGVDPTESPEHNRLQLKFLDPEHCVATVAALTGGVPRTAKQVAASLGREVGVFADLVKPTEASEPEAQMESRSIDVIFSYEPASAHINWYDFPACSCPKAKQGKWPDIVTGVGKEETEEERLTRESLKKKAMRMDLIRASREAEEKALKKGGVFVFHSDHRGEGIRYEKVLLGSRKRPTLEQFRQATKHKTNCPRYGEDFYRIWVGRSQNLAMRDGKVCVVAIECKPSLGDDYPAVLRQVSSSRRQAEGLADRLSETYWGGRDLFHVVVIESFNAQAATLEDVREVFRRSDVRLLTTSEIDQMKAKIRGSAGGRKSPAVVLASYRDKMKTSDYEVLRKAVETVAA